MKEYYAQEFSCKYRWNEQHTALEYAAEMSGGTFDDYNLVEEDLVGEEPVIFQGKEMTLSDVYRIVERILE